MPYKTTPEYEQLRETAFRQSAAALETHADPFGVIMETGYPDGVATIVAMHEGDSGVAASLYFSNGGGVIGAGTHLEPARAAQTLLDTAGDFMREMHPVSSHPLPERGETRLYLLAQDGMLGASAAEVEFGENRHPLSPLFFAAHELIGRIAEMEQRTPYDQEE